jgi:hypothetical protein
LDIASLIYVPHWRMSERATYLRDQADKCRQHANMVGDARTRDELRRLAAVYIARAAEIESKGGREEPYISRMLSS